MTNPARPNLRLTLSAALLALLCIAGSFPPASAQTVAQAIARTPDRLTGAIDNSRRAALPGSMVPRAAHSTDLGAIPPSTPLQGISLVFSRSAAQEADLDQLLAAQQNPASPQFHQWLTPAQFGARFGISANDLAAAQGWLQSQGFAVDPIGVSRDRLTFSGTASAVEIAFGAPLHYFKATSGSMAASNDALTHIAPANDFTLPAALAPLVRAVGNLSNYRTHANLVRKSSTDFTSSASGSHYLSPKDIATIYDLNPVYNAGFTGTGQTIVIAGRSQIVLSDIANFQSAAGVAVNTPATTLVPNSGSPVFSTGDEAESDIDIEYSSSIANKAAINLVYTGNSQFLDVPDAVVYAINNDLGQLISVSYSFCEPDAGIGYTNYYEPYFKQAGAQGQTIFAASGDTGSTGCYGDGTSNSLVPSVGYIASSAYVTGVGGTEFLPADTASTNSTYFQATTVTGTASNDIVSSALSYIPEQAWNDDAVLGSPASGGGGTSIYIPRPSWQTAFPGIPAGSYRLVPDISLDSALESAPLLYCTSDTGSGGVSFQGSCTSGFRVSGGTTLTAGGGTSFATPIFAGMMAVLNQAKGYNTGQGLINPTLYSLASNATTYASAFHDTTVGGNQCTAGSGVCGTGAATTSYPTTVGYDEATGLGSVDFYKLVQAWPQSTNTLVSSTTTASANTANPAVNTTDAITVQVRGLNSTPTGSVSLTDTVNGTPIGTATSYPIANGAVTIPYKPTTAGIHQLVVTYSGDLTFATSKATLQINAGSVSFTFTTPSVTVSSGSTVTEVVTVTPVGGYTGTVELGLTAGPSINYACFSGPTSVTVSGTTPVTASYTLYTNNTNCTSSTSPLSRSAGNGTAAVKPQPAPGAPSHRTPLGTPMGIPVSATLAGLLLAGCFKRRSNLLRAGLALGLVLGLGLTGLGLTGCSNNTAAAGGTTTTNAYSPLGSYSFTVGGSDSLDAAVNTTSNFTLTITQ